MALYPTRQETREFLRRTNTRLVISGGESPAEPFMVDPVISSVFYSLFSEDIYSRNKGAVVIGKGRIVSLKAAATIRGKKGKTLLRVCNGTVPPVGIAPYHYFWNEDLDDPQVITYLSKPYIEVPYVATAGEADAIKTGVAYGTLAEGDFVKSDSLGRFIRDTADPADPRFLLGRVIAVETSVPPQGWLEWAMLPGDLLAAEGIKDLKPLGTKPSSYVPQEGAPYPYDPNYAWPIYQDARGIEFLSDGSFFESLYTDEQILNTDGTDGSILAGDILGNIKTWYVKNPPISTIDSGGSLRDPVLTLKAGARVMSGSVTYDVKTGKIAYTCDAADEAEISDVLVSATYYRGPGIPGIPVNWDVAGGLGAVRIQLLI